MNRFIWSVVLMIILLTGMIACQGTTQENEQSSEPAIVDQQSTQTDDKGPSEGNQSGDVTEAEQKGNSETTTQTQEPEKKTQTNTNIPVYILLLVTLAGVGLILYRMKRQRDCLADVDDSLRRIFSSTKDPSGTDNRSQITNLVTDLTKEVRIQGKNIQQLQAQLQETQRLPSLEEIREIMTGIPPSIDISPIITSLEQIDQRLQKIETNQAQPGESATPAAAVTIPEANVAFSPPTQFSFNRVQPLNQDAAIKEIMQEFYIWNTQGKNKQTYFYSEKPIGQELLLALAPRCNDVAFREVPSEQQHLCGKDFFDVVTIQGFRAGHVNSVSKPMIMLVKDGISTLKQKGSYYEGG